MTFSRTSFIAGAIVLAMLAGVPGPVRDASACGGCFPPPRVATQVTDHRMVFSISPSATTLWDQIQYTGEPSSFAWVLPIKGQVDVGLSSDALFQELDTLTTVIVDPPANPCVPLSTGPGVSSTATGFGSSSSTGGGTGGGVTIIAEEVVGPYETVQLSSQDPAALTEWLQKNGYAIDEGIVPVIEAYVTEGFDFLALKLAPGEGIDKMKPVRVTTPGAGSTLPLRMVAAGTGAFTSITLWIVGEGRYEPTNFGTFTIPQSAVVWDWASLASNYAQLRQRGFDECGTWLLQAAEAIAKYTVTQDLQSLAADYPDLSGYADAMGMGAPEACSADLDALFGRIQAPWITRYEGLVPRAQLDEDLVLAASTDQTSHDRFLEVGRWINAACEPYSQNAPAPDESLCGGPGTNAGGAGVVPGTATGGGCGCATSGSDGTLGLAVAALGLIALAGRRRRRD